MKSGNKAVVTQSNYDVIARIFIFRRLASKSFC